MTITYTQHALARMAERGIGQQEVEATLKNPFRQIPVDHGRIESQGFIERSGNKQLLRVISEGHVVVLVVTVIATSKFQKYGVSI
jgi:primosomal protein N'